MSIAEILICSLILCGLFNIVIITFPEKYKQTAVRKKINLLLIISACIYTVIFVVFIFINYYCDIPQIDLKISLLIIPLLSIVIFVANIYYPSVRFSIVAKQNKYDFATELYQYITRYRFESTEEREEIIKSIEAFMLKYQKELHNSSEKILLQTLINQSTTITKKAPEKLIDLIENDCIKIMDDANSQENPFSHVCLISSFCLSSILTILIAIIAL